jgi:hypothetical protein
VKMRSNHWSGTDLFPLPHESAASALWRFAWRNALDASQLKRLSSDTNGYPFIINTERFSRVSTWLVPGIEEIDFSAYSRRDANLWQDPHFRYCPLCLEHGYHSFWFQCPLLDCCPIHALALSTRCHACDAELAQYPSSRALMEKAYYCAHCHAPICGAPPTLMAHLEFRERAQELTCAFQPLLTWWKSIRAEPKNVCWMETWRTTTDAPSTWCIAEEFMRSIISSGTILPLCFRRSRYRDITILSWRIRSNRKHRDQFNSRRFSWHGVVKTARAVYRCTLRILESWIMEHEGLSAQAYRRHFDFQLVDVDGRKGIDVRDYQPRLLALCLMRWQLESGMAYRLFVESRFAELYQQPSIDKYLCDPSTPRLQWRAIFLAIYAAWYHRVLATGRSKWLDFEVLCACKKEYVFSATAIESIDENTRVLTGDVAFPAIEGLSSLTHSKLGIPAQRDRQNWQIFTDAGPPQMVTTLNG